MPLQHGAVRSEPRFYATADHKVHQAPLSPRELGEQPQEYLLAEVIVLLSVDRELAVEPFGLDLCEALALHVLQGRALGGHAEKVGDFFEGEGFQFVAEKRSGHPHRVEHGVRDETILPSEDRIIEEGIECYRGSNPGVDVRQPCWKFWPPDYLVWLIVQLHSHHLQLEPWVQDVVRRWHFPERVLVVEISLGVKKKQVLFFGDWKHGRP